jgi:PTH1 family peptidyl-tRNA hydrolase
LKKPAPDQKIVIDTCIDRTLKALALMVSGDMVKATQVVHTSKPPRPKPPRPATAILPKKGELHETSDNSFTDAGPAA